MMSNGVRGMYFSVVCFLQNVVRVDGWEYGPRLLRPKEIVGLLVSPGKASTQLIDHMNIYELLRSEPAQEKWFKSNHPYI